MLKVHVVADFHVLEVELEFLVGFEELETVGTLKDCLLKRAREHLL